MLDFFRKDEEKDDLLGLLEGVIGEDYLCPQLERTPSGGRVPVDVEEDFLRAARQNEMNFGRADLRIRSIELGLLWIGLGIIGDACNDMWCILIAVGLRR